MSEFVDQHFKPDESPYKKSIFELFSFIDAPLLAFNTELKIVAATAQIRQFAQEKNLIEGSNLILTFPWLKKHEEEIQETLQQQKTLILELQELESELKKCQLTIAPLVFASNVLYLIKLNFSDSKKIVEKMEKMDRLASLGVLTAGLVHELKNVINFMSASVNPIRSNFNDMISLIQKIENDPTSDAKEVIQAFLDCKKELSIDEVILETLQLLSGLKEGCDRMFNIITNVRPMTQVSSSYTEIQIEESLDATLSLLHHQLKYGIQVHKKYANTAKIFCNPVKINQVILNILINAIDSMPNQKGSIWITTSMANDDREVVISIKDSGCGMDEKVKSRIFEFFFTTKNSGGAGMGLGISNAIIAEHGGRIMVNSQAGNGSEFIIRIPCKIDLPVEPTSSTLQNF